jgi:hypothetical protein
MRFRGGGVGHKATQERTEPMSQEADAMAPDENDFEEDNLESFGDGEELEEEASEASSESDIAGEGDRDHDEAEAQKEVGELVVEEEFDGEDGEEPWGIDEYMTEGYAPP